MTKRLYAIPLALATLALVAVATAVLAENIDPNNDNSQFSWSENAGWLNAEPANCANCGLQVNNTTFTGYLWGENIGWINMNCQNNATCAGPAGNWGVARNPSSGSLSGYAWSENKGWFNMSCVTNSACAGAAGNWGVTISPSTGIFSGYAWGENIGWVSFSDTSPVAYRVQTFADRDADGPLDDVDNCPAVSNANQVNGDGDSAGDLCDACPATADPNACPDDDNDGFTDVNESGAPLCLGAVNNDGPPPPTNPMNDDALVNDGCPAVGPVEANCADAVDDDNDGRVNDGCPQEGTFAEGQFKIGTGSADPCGNNGWPLELVSTPAITANRYTVSDLGSFVSGLKKLGKNPGEPGYDSRWDIVPGPVTGAPGLGWINVQDLAATSSASTTAFPPMLGGVKVSNQFCPYPP